MNDGKFYDPSEVRLIVNGIDITGFSDGKKIKIEPVTKELYKSHCGVDGDTSFTKVHDNRHTITFTLKQGSPSNIILDGLSKLPASMVVGVINNSEGRYVGGGTGARIAERPTIGFASDDGKREWKILVPDYSGAPLPDLSI